jgi:hypothetical protein
MPLEWATGQNNLACALAGLGERESGTARLEEAAEAFRAALEEQTRDRVPLDWAMTEAGLGSALLARGESECSRKFGRTFLIRTGGLRGDGEARPGARLAPRS